METKELLLNEITKVPNEIHQSIMRFILDYIYKFNFVKEVAVEDINEYSSYKFTKEDIIISLQLFCLLKNSPLEAKFYFYENEETELLYLTKKEVREARNNGYFIHPQNKNQYSLDIYGKNILLNFETIQ